MQDSITALVGQLVPVIQTYADFGKITAADIRFSTRLLNDLPGSVVSTAITRALRQAGFRPTNETEKSDVPSARSRRVLVWRRAGVSEHLASTRVRGLRPPFLNPN